MRTMLKMPVEVWLPCIVDIQHCDINLAINQFIVGNNLNSYSLHYFVSTPSTNENHREHAFHRHKLLQWIPHYNGHSTMVAYNIS